MLKFNIAWPTFVWGERKKCCLLWCLHSFPWANQFFISITHLHAFDRSRGWSALAQRCSTATLVHIAKSHYGGFRASDLSRRGWVDFPLLSSFPWSSFSLNSEHKLPNIPSGRRWLFTGRYMDLDQMLHSNAHTYIIYYIQGGIAAIYAAIILWFCNPDRDMIPAPSGVMFNYLANYIRAALEVQLLSQRNMTRIFSLTHVLQSLCSHWVFECLLRWILGWKA